MPRPGPSSPFSAPASAAGRRDGSAPPTALTQGNHALRDGDPAQAIRHHALGLVDEPSHRDGPIAAQLAANLVRARRRARVRARWQIRPEQQVVIFLGTPRRHKGLLEKGYEVHGIKRRASLFNMSVQQRGDQQ
ncbi:hypothetical protein Thiowin_04036 [Thiorhodovibrio winogradskyi]|uniref:Uncharacterized protein n=1 Tax=Thiorhodovibrio winogradskyi TaxID=77007 RepID=A0ABZ0SH41_9GAMM|nr:hypothetical protein [Thiorhodovibrio winogradskyi]